MNYLSALVGVIDVSQFPPWVVPTAGGVSVVLVLLVAMSLMRKRRPAQRPAPARPTMLSMPRQDTARNGTGEERRRWPRRGGNPTAVIVNDATRRGEPEPGWIVDRSEGGVCLLFGREVRPDSRVQIRVANAPSNVPWVEVTARYCRPIGERWHIGCQFVEPPAMMVLLMFG